jgi:hypothetical protein
MMNDEHESDELEEPSERPPLGELRPDDRGQDQVREELEESIGRGEPRPLTREEREAAERDRGPARTVYAPASARVSKQPLPADEKLITHPDQDTNERRRLAEPVTGDDHAQGSANAQ